jgi:Primase C terminal 2 (PriCT-2)
MRSDGVYCWCDSLPIAAAPAWLLELVQEKEREPRELDPFAQFANSIRQTSMAELTLATAMIPNTLKTDRDTWVRVGFALWSATGGSAEGYRLFAAWSRRWPNYNAKKTRTFWDTINTPPRDITAGTIFFLAEQNAPDWKSRVCSRDPRVIKLLREFHKLLGEP